jgi:hypothetical protein
MTNVTVIGDISGPGSRRRAQLGIGGGSCRTGGCVPQLRRRLRALNTFRGREEERMVLSHGSPARIWPYDPEQDSAIGIETKLNVSRAAILTKFGCGAYPALTR